MTPDDEAHAQLLRVVSQRLALAEQAEPGWPTVIGIVEGDVLFVAPDAIVEHIAHNSPTAVGRACRADINRLGAHHPIMSPWFHVGPICADEWADGDGYVVPWRGCHEVRVIAEVYEVVLDG